MDLSMAASLAWGFGTLAAYGMTFRLRLFSYWRHRDDRSRRDVMVWGALFLAALSSVAAFLVVALAFDGPSVRRLLSGAAFGAFSLAGLLALTETPSEDPERSRRDLRHFLVGGAIVAVVFVVLLLARVIR